MAIAILLLAVATSVCADAEPELISDLYDQGTQSEVGVTMVTEDTPTGGSTEQGELLLARGHLQIHSTGDKSFLLMANYRNVISFKLRWLSTIYN